MDKEALSILTDVYPTRRVVGVNMAELYSNGGVAHCVATVDWYHSSLSTSAILDEIDGRRRKREV